MAKTDKKFARFLSGALASLNRLPKRKQKTFKRRLADIVLAFWEGKLKWVKSDFKDRQALFELEKQLEELKLFPLQVAVELAQSQPPSSNTIATVGEIARQSQAQKKKGQK